MTVRQRTLVLFSTALYLFLIVFLFFRVERATGGPFVYPLDDPYIHLALAENLAHGHYGINPGEFSSPSSSILWPLLLIPFAGTWFHVYVPLAWNVLFGLIATSLIAYAVSQWPPQGAAHTPVPFWKQAATITLLLFTANLPSLTILGMEHVLQILLAVCCAVGMCRALSGQPIPAWCLLAAALAPIVRYEDLSLTLAVSFALYGVGRRRAALMLFGASLVPLLAFSAYLWSRHLPLLPMSVLVKGHAYNGQSLPERVILLLIVSLHHNLTQIVRYPVLLLSMAFLALFFRARTIERRFIFGGAAVLGALQLTIGRFGWFHRYEVYAVIFLSIVLLRVLAERPPIFFPFFAMGLMLCAGPSFEAAATTASASRAVWEQQYQMHRFLSGFYRGDYAVNDLGLASFERRPGAYVLDVYGLASPEASRQTNKTAVWLAGITQLRGTDLAILYPEWFKIPESWTPLAQLCVDDMPSTLLGEKCSVFYSTAPKGEEALRGELRAFAATVPREIGFYLARPAGQGAMWHLVTAPTMAQQAP